MAVRQAIYLRKKIFMNTLFLLENELKMWVLKSYNQQSKKKNVKTFAGSENF